MLAGIKVLVRRAARSLGIDLVPYFEYPPEIGLVEREVIESCRLFTMTDTPRLVGLVQAIQYVVSAQVPGAIVECGVWRGGSMMVAARTLVGLGCGDRDLYLYDTFAGMPAPTDRDRSFRGEDARHLFAQQVQQSGGSDWCFSGLEEVQRNLASTGYSPERLHFVEGRVEDTIPARVPERIALLRLDTDWYESTRHEFEHLYPRLVPGGVLILDDYGHWQGARQATDEYFQALGVRPLLTCLGYTGRIAIKPPAAG